MLFSIAVRRPDGSYEDFTDLDDLLREPRADAPFLRKRLPLYAEHMNEGLSLLPEYRIIRERPDFEVPSFLKEIEEMEAEGKKPAAPTFSRKNRKMRLDLAMWKDEVRKLERAFPGNREILVKLARLNVAFSRHDVGHILDPWIKPTNERAAIELQTSFDELRTKLSTTGLAYLERKIGDLRADVYRWFRTPSGEPDPFSRYFHGLFAGKRSLIYPDQLITLAMSIAIWERDDRKAYVEDATRRFLAPLSRVNRRVFEEAVVLIRHFELCRDLLQYDPRWSDALVDR